MTVVQLGRVMRAVLQQGEYSREHDWWWSTRTCSSTWYRHMIPHPRSPAERAGLMHATHPHVSPPLLILGWGWSVDLSFRRSLTVPYLWFAFLSTTLVQPRALLTDRLPGSCGAWRSKSLPWSTWGDSALVVPTISFPMKRSSLTTYYIKS